jgi:RNA polymerase sigma-70 factor (ECF subfamily)
MDGTAASAAGNLDELLGHGDVLLRYAVIRVGDRATAEDLVQDTLVAAVDKCAEFAGKSSMRTWLVGILRHKIVDHFRWHQRHPGDRPDHAEHAGPAGQTGGAGPDEDPWFTPAGTWRIDPNAGLEILDDSPSRAVERSQLRAALQFCIDHLPRQLHRVFVLREIEELEPDDACTAAAISRDSLAVFLYRARQALRACMQKKWGTP